MNTQVQSSSGRFATQAAAIHYGPPIDDDARLVTKTPITAAALAVENSDPLVRLEDAFTKWLSETDAVIAKFKRVDLLGEAVGLLQVEFGGVFVRVKCSAGGMVDESGYCDGVIEIMDTMGCWGDYLNGTGNFDWSMSFCAAAIRVWSDTVEPILAVPIPDRKALLAFWTQFKSEQFTQVQRTA